MPDAGVCVPASGDAGVAPICTMRCLRPGETCFRNLNTTLPLYGKYRCVMSCDPSDAGCPAGLVCYDVGNCSNLAIKVINFACVPREYAQ